MEDKNDLKSGHDGSETTQVLSGIFEDRVRLSEAIDALKSAGVTSDHMLIVSQSDAEEVADSIPTDPESAAASGAAIGGVSGTALGVLLSTASVIMLPGFGALLAAGVMGAASGVTLGSYLGAIYGSRYASQIKYDIHEELASGSTLILVDLAPFDSGRREQISDLLAAHDAEHVEIFEIESEVLKENNG